MFHFCLGASAMSVMVISIIVAIVSLAVFFIIFFLVKSKKKRIREEKERVERQKAEEAESKRREQARKDAERRRVISEDEITIRPRSKQAFTGEYAIADAYEDVEKGQHKHWGNLPIGDRYASLAPEDKVLYMAAKKQLDNSVLQNFTTEICEVYFIEERPAARLLIYRGLIYLFVSVPPFILDEQVFNHEDVSDKEGYEMLPTMIIIRESAQIDKIPRLISLIV